MAPTPVDLMRFVHELRSDFFETAAGLGWTEFTRDRGVSMHSFREIFLHLAYVEEQHILHFCEGRATRWPAGVMEIPKSTYRTVGSIRRRLHRIARIAERKFPSWEEPGELDVPATWVAAGKYTLRLSRGSALTQCVTEHLLHLGEVEAMLWQLDVEPPTTYWIDRGVLHHRWPPPRSAVLSRAELRSLARSARARRRTSKVRSSQRGAKVARRARSSVRPARGS